MEVYWHRQFQYLFDSKAQFMVTYILLPIVFMIILMALFLTMASSGTKEKFYQTLLTKVTSLKFILPEEYREPMTGDILEIDEKLKQKGHKPSWRAFVILFHLTSLIWYTFRFKLDEGDGIHHWRPLANRRRRFCCRNVAFGQGPSVTAGWRLYVVSGQCIYRRYLAGAARLV